MILHDRQLSATGKRAQTRGFTLIEVLVVVVLIGILVTIAAPNMRGWVSATNVNAVMRGVTNDLAYARALAVRSGYSADFTVNATGTQYTITTQHLNAAGTGITTRQAKRVNLADDASGFTLAPAPTTLTFSSRGLLTTGAVTLKTQGKGQVDSVAVLASGLPYRAY